MTKVLRILIFLLIGWSPFQLLASEDSLLTLIQSENVDSTRLDLYVELGWELVDLEPEKALRYAKEAEVIVKRIQDPYRANGVYRLKAFCYGNMNDRPNCLDNHLIRINILNAVRDSSVKMMAAYYEAAAVLISQGQRETAEEYFERSADIAQKKGMKAMYGQVLMQLADLKLAKGDVEGCKTDLYTGYQMCKEDRPLVAAVCLSNLAQMYIDSPDSISKGKAYIDTAIVVLGDSPDPEYAGFTYKSLGQLYYAEGNYSKAKLWMDKAKVGWEAHQKIWYLQELYLLLGQTHAKLGTDSIGYYYDKHLELSNDAINEDNNSQVAEMEARFKNQEKEKEIVLLSKEKEISKIESKRQGQQILFITIGLIAVGVFSIFLISRIRLIRKQNKLITKQKEEVIQQKEIVEEKSREIMDSILYAKRIQGAALPDPEKLRSQFEDSFVSYIPKDELSGDYYWVGKMENTRGDVLDLVIVGDCTGHGVPGALLSILGINYLNVGQSSGRLNTPSDILDFLNSGIHDTFGAGDGAIRDGMDIAVAAIDRKQNKLYYSCAKNPVYLVRNEELQVLKGDRHSIGKDAEGTEPKPFTTHEVDLEPGDSLYLFSDGFADQFGGPKGKKLGYRKFREMLIRLNTQLMPAVKTELEDAFKEWKLDNEQVDDVCVIGVRV